MVNRRDFLVAAMATPSMAKLATAKQVVGGNVALATLSTHTADEPSTRAEASLGKPTSQPRQICPYRRAT